ncbi:MAG: hypothetical protein CMM30_07355 [Rhodospirillaceae bacterium]|nr:hypothetical protein [Rhodospirillaceae bacterium]|tara:strand:+ start:580 stop:957 length:378 start_codon:yes stop_codon:yes gene_type:complete
MEVTPLLTINKQVIKAYNSNGFDVNGEHFTGNIFVLPNKTEYWEVSVNADKLEPTDFEKHLSNQLIDVLLIGTGNTFIMVSENIRSSMRKIGIGVESMDTSAACRTYNILLSEGRNVAAALIVSE